MWNSHYFIFLRANFVDLDWPYNLIILWRIPYIFRDEVNANTTKKRAHTHRDQLKLIWIIEEIKKKKQISFIFFLLPFIILRWMRQCYIGKLTYIVFSFFKISEHFALFHAHKRNSLPKMRIIKMKKKKWKEEKIENKKNYAHSILVIKSRSFQFLFLLLLLINNYLNAIHCDK